MPEKGEGRPTVDQPDPKATTSRKARQSRMRTPGLPGAEPGLPPTAQRLLEAAGRLLARSGYNSLTLEAIGLEAGENKALVRYYFGSKNGLLVALVDGLVSDTLWQTQQRLSMLSNKEDRSRLVVETLGAILADAQGYRLLYDLLPRLLENPAMTGQLAQLYRAYRDLNTRALWGDRAEDAPEAVRDVAAMTVALTDGLAVQLQTASTSPVRLPYGAHLSRECLRPRPAPTRTLPTRRTAPGHCDSVCRHYSAEIAT
jgi:AcrR family transcriptional regulator